MPIGCWITSQRGLAPGVDSYRMGPDVGADAVAPGEELGGCDGVALLSLMTQKCNRFKRQSPALIINPTISFCRLLASDHVKLVLHVLSEPMATEGNPKIKQTA